MARSDLILNLVRSAHQGDRRKFERSVEAMIAEERAKHHGIFAGKLEEELRKEPVNGSGNGISSLNGTNSHDACRSVVQEYEPRQLLENLVLPKLVASGVAEVIEEQKRADLLRSHGMEPRHRILLTGPPGNGKTSLAEAIATQLMLPVISPRYESLIGSYLGETANRLAKVFEYARGRHCILFFDEFDTLGRERADPQETGEIKRVVSSLLLQIDSLPSHVIVVVATNHPETLDRAVWRRFQLRLELPAPSLAEAGRWFERWSDSTGEDLGLTSRILSHGLNAASFAELQDFCDDVRRQLVLAGPDAENRRRSIFQERLAQWKSRAKG